MSDVLKPYAVAVMLEHKCTEALALAIRARSATEALGQAVAGMRKQYPKARIQAVVQPLDDEEPCKT